MALFYLHSVCPLLIFSTATQVYHNDIRTFGPEAVRVIFSQATSEKNNQAGDIFCVHSRKGHKQKKRMLFCFVLSFHWMKNRFFSKGNWVCSNNRELWLCPCFWEDRHKKPSHDFVACSVQVFSYLIDITNMTYAITKTKTKAHDDLILLCIYKCVKKTVFH